MIRIVTDSAADLTAEQLSVPGIFVVPLSVTFADGTTQLDDGTMTKDEFFVRLAEDSKLDRKSTRLNSSHDRQSRMPSSA